jgi:hypothetical protein
MSQGLLVRWLMEGPTHFEVLANPAFTAEKWISNRQAASSIYWENKGREVQYFEKRTTWQQSSDEVTSIHNYSIIKENLTILCFLLGEKISTFSRIRAMSAYLQPSHQSFQIAWSCILKDNPIPEFLQVCTYESYLWIWRFKWSLLGI